ncbi:MAG: TRAP transporter small permease subunit [Betaproteobacteria bacterium]|nr:TRAP transporter small permease subunit [Betaproteobacteria bacterium]
MLARLERAGLLATRALSVVGLVALMALAAMTLADGLMRWLANRPIEGVRDVGAVIVAVAVSCCLPVGLMERGHVSIRLVPALLGERAGRILDALAALVVEAVMIAIAWQFTVFAGKIARANETTWVLKIPTAPFWYVVAAILWTAVLVQAIVVVLQFARSR